MKTPAHAAQMRLQRFRIGRVGSPTKGIRTHSFRAPTIESSLVIHASRMRLWPSIWVGSSFKTIATAGLLSLSMIVFFGTLLAAARFYPAIYHWRITAISRLTSPLDNPQLHGLPAIGVMVAIVLALPCIPYIVTPLHVINPPLAWAAGETFAWSFGGMFFSMAAQIAQQALGKSPLHNRLAYVSAALFVVGMFCCFACAVKDRRCPHAARPSLPFALFWYWMSLGIAPIALFAGMAVLIFGEVYLTSLGGGRIYDAIQPAFYHLAFWEWVGIGEVFAFLAGSVFMLPASAEAWSPVHQSKSLMTAT